MQNRLKEGEALFAEGKISEAEKIFDDLLKENPENHELLNDLGVVSYSQNDVQEAEYYFLRAIVAKEDYFDALLNLSKLYQIARRWEEAANQLEKCISIADQNTDIFNQLSKVYLKIGDTEKAKVTLRKSLELNPDQEIVRESLSALEGDVGVPGKAVEKSTNDQDLRKLLNKARLQQSPRTKIVVLCLPGLQSFLGDIVDFLKTKYDVRTCYSKNNQEIESAVQWADIVWLEWANEMAIHVTNNVPSVSEKQVICRIHSYEVLNGYLPRIQWSKISKTVFVADHVLKIALELCPSISHLTEPIVIPNGVNLRNYPFKERKPGFNIGVVGSIDHKKNPVMWIEVLSRLMQIDVRYTLKVAGRIQELRYKYYMESIIPKLGLTNNIRFFGHVDDVAKWFETNDISYLLTTSPFESFGYSIAEAMAMGYRPLIHAFPSAEEMWPADCVFGCTDELIQLLQDGQNYASRKYRQFVEQNYSLHLQLEEIEAVIAEIVEGISGKAPSSGSRCQSSIQAQQHLSLPPAFAKYHRPEKNVIVTGIPRSGTSLFSVILNTFDNAVCLNEILYDVDSLPRDFAEIRRRLIAGEPIPNRYDSSGKLTTDTQSADIKVNNRVVQGGNIDEHVVIGSKINIPYLNQIQKILDYGYKVIAIVRDPVYTIASWNSEKANIIPEAHVTDVDMHPRWQRFRFTSADKIERQAQIWNFYAHLIWNLRDKIKIYTYELLTSDMEWVIKDMSKFIGLETSTSILEVSNQNIESKYPKIEEIKEAVKKYCPVKDVFAYNYLDYENTEDPGGKHDDKRQDFGGYSKHGQTTWSRAINYSKKPILSEKGDNSSHLIIAFGGIANQLYLPPFEFFRATNSLPYSRILVRDFNQGWYHLGADQNLTTFEAVLQELRNRVENLNPETICTVGTSAGGYAALAFGHFLEVDCVHALAPQTLIDQDNRKRIGETRWHEEITRIYENQPSSSWFYDLRKLLKQRNGKTVYNIHVCKSHPFDMAYAQHVEDLHSLNIMRYDCAAHNIARHLKDSHLLADFLKQ